MTTKKTKSHPGKIVWAVNPFDQETTVLENLANVLVPLAQKMEATIEPVFVMSTVNLLSQKVIGDVPVKIQASIEDMLKNLSVPHLPPRILIRDAKSLSEAAKALDGYVRDTGAELIAVGTHGRKGLPRVFLGSFAETLLLHAKSPILSVGPKSHEARPIKHILFPTDFQKTSEVMFPKIINLAFELGAKLTVFHSFQPLADSGIPYSAMTYGIFYFPDNYFREIEQANVERTNERVNRARARDVQCDSVIATRGSSIAETIATYSDENNVDLIAMAAQSGTIETALLGSVTRQVVRQAPCPVWIMRSKS